MRLRLPTRPGFDYQTRRDNFVWPDHVLRVVVTGGVIAWMNPDTIIDPACGDGSIVAAAHRINPISAAVMNDISVPNYDYITGDGAKFLPPRVSATHNPIEVALGDDRVFDVVVLTEILEHVEDPVSILRMARRKAAGLVASSPLFADASTIDNNPEHLWQFDAGGYGDMLTESGWDPVSFVPIHFTSPAFPYTFQIWTAR